MAEREEVKKQAQDIRSRFDTEAGALASVGLTSDPDTGEIARSQPVREGTAEEAAEVEAQFPSEPEGQVTEEPLVEDEEEDISDLFGALQSRAAGMRGSEGAFTDLIGYNASPESEYKDVLDLVKVRAIKTDQPLDYVEAKNQALADIRASGSGQEIIQSEKQALRNRFRAEYFNTPELMDESLVEYQNRRMEEILDYDGVEDELTTKLMTATASESERLAETRYMASFRRLTDLGQQNGTLDNLGDAVANFVFDLDFFLSDIGVTNLDNLVTGIEDYQGRTEAEKLAMSEELDNWVWETSDGNLENALTLRALFEDPDFKDAMYERAAWASTELLGIGIGAVVQKALRKGRNIKDTMKNLGNKDAAAKTNAEQVRDTDGKLNAILDQDTTDVALEAHPALTGGAPLAPKAVAGFPDRIAIQDEAATNAYKSLEATASRNKLSLEEANQLRRQIEAEDLNIQQLRNKKAELSKSLPKAQNKKAVQEELDVLKRELSLAGSRKGGYRTRLNRSLEAKRASQDVAAIQAGKVPPRYAKLVDNEAQKLEDAFYAQRAFRPIDEMVRTKKSNTTAKPQEEIANSPGRADMANRNAKNALYQGSLTRIRRAFQENREATPRMVSAAARKDAEASAISRLDYDLKSQGHEKFSIEKVKSLPDGIQVKVRTEGGAKEVTQKFVRNELGGYDIAAAGRDAAVSVILGKVLSPDALVGRLSEDFKKMAIEGASFAGAQTDRFFRDIQRAVQSVFKPLSKSDRTDLNGLLEAGDEEGVVFSINRLRQGIELEDGRVYPNSQTIEAYYAMRGIYDEMHTMFDHSIREAMEMEGFKTLTYLNRNGELIESVGKVYNSAQGLKINDGSTIKVVEDGNVRYNQWKTVQGLSSQDNYKLVKLAQRETLGTNSQGFAKEIIEYVLVREGREVSLSELPARVLKFEEGYIPRIAPKGNWFVRLKGDTGHKTLISAETRAAAQKWADENVPDMKISIDQDGDFTQTEQTLEIADRLGGLFTGARKSEPVQYVRHNGEVTKRERLSAFESTDKYFAAVSRASSTAKLRSGLIAKWENSIRELAGEKAGDLPPLTMDTILKDVLDDVPERQALIDMQEWLQMHMGVGGRDERVMETFFRQVNNIIEGKDFFNTTALGRGIRQSTRDAAFSGGNRKLLSLTFDLHLGWFNPAQLFVQASNATLAMSMHPIRGAKAIPRALSMRSALFMDDLKNNPRFADGLRDFSGTGFDDATEAFRKSGLKDEIMRVSDFGGVEKQLGKGSFLSYQKLAKTGRVMFTEGEMFNRLLTFNIAYDKWLAKNAGKKLADDPVEIQNVVQDSRRMMMNMQRENSAWWQNNLAAYPLQFMQVFAKFVENMLPKMLGGTGNWTGKEKSSIIAGQLALYGAGGVAFSDQLSGYASEFLGIDGQQFVENNPSTTTAINEGLTGMMLEAVGLGVNASERVSLLAGLNEVVPVQLVKSLWTAMNGGRPEDGVEILAGPTLNTMRRANDGLSRTIAALADLYHVPTVETLGDTIFEAAKGFAGLTSTGNSVIRRWEMEKYGGIFSKNGNMIMSYPELQNYSETEILFHVFGFPLDEIQQYYKSRYTTRPSLAEERIEIKKQYQRAFERYSETNNEAVWNADKRLITERAANFNAAELMGEVYQEVMNGKSAMSSEAEARYKLRFRNARANTLGITQGFEGVQ